jgi:hypothetical protein
MFLHVCPEPVLVKWSFSAFLNEKWEKEIVFSYLRNIRQVGDPLAGVERAAKVLEIKVHRGRPAETDKAVSPFKYWGFMLCLSRACLGKWDHGSQKKAF